MLKKTVITAIVLIIAAAAQSYAAPDQPDPARRGQGRRQGMMRQQGQQGQMLCEQCRQKVQRYRRQLNAGHNVERPELCTACKQKVQQRHQRMRQGRQDRPTGDQPQRRMRQGRPGPAGDDQLAPARQGQRRHAQAQKDTPKDKPQPRKQMKQGAPERPELCKECRKKVQRYRKQMQRYKNAQKDQPGSKQRDIKADKDTTRKMDAKPQQRRRQRMHQQDCDCPDCRNMDRPQRRMQRQGRPFHGDQAPQLDRPQGRFAPRFQQQRGFGQRQQFRQDRGFPQQQGFRGQRPYGQGRQFRQQRGFGRGQDFGGQRGYGRGFSGQQQGRQFRRQQGFGQQYGPQAPRLQQFRRRQMQRFDNYDYPQPPRGPYYQPNRNYPAPPRY
ncbi:hypothetical protein STSP2_00305 [Anaerohalosphaera lusitana]|uniref:Uncharacterized protein n=1 Tax=Anaerohalosphaera lusitana TaxID=1936003 RepID=A0A1U9NGV2_9BACT|nr:hypothetical protein [Anaerohalosphaera lusitana]AQT67162.1 hypothetical protein STSP2_00305 [Anaerohalosphaera lusitana]